MIECVNLQIGFGGVMRVKVRGQFSYFSTYFLSVSLFYIQKGFAPFIPTG